MNRLTKDRINVYRTYKSIIFIIYNSYDKSGINGHKVYNVQFMELFSAIVKQLSEKGYLTNITKNNINNYLSKARELNDEGRNKRIDIINDIIRIMNSQKQDNSLELYREELMIRRLDKKYLKKYPDEVIKQEVSNMDLSIAYDYTVLYSHSEIVTDEEFAEIYLPNLINNSLYYENINSILQEQPLVFKDEYFYSRMMCVFNMNKEINNNSKYIVNLNKDVIKRIKKNISI